MAGMTQQGTAGAPWSARQWLVVLLVGLALTVVGYRLSYVVAAVGLVALTVGVVGLAWRLLKGR